MPRKPSAQPRIPNNIREIREDRGLTQQQLADRLNTSQPHVDRLEKGTNQLTLDWMHRFAIALDCHVTELSSLFARPKEEQEILDLVHEMSDGERAAYRAVGLAMAERGRPDKTGTSGG